MKIISVVNQKGGTGKTTTIVNLSSYLALAGKKVLVVDFDPQANACSGFGVRDVKKGVYELMCGKITISEAIMQVEENLFLIPSTADLSGANIEMANLDNKERVLEECLSSLSLKFDFVLIDTPPSLGLLTVNSLIASSFVLIPVQAEYYALEGLGQLLTTLHLIRENIRPQLSVLGAVVTMYNERPRLSQEILNNLYQNFPYRIFRTVIPRNIRLAEAPSFGSSIFKYAPNSRGARAYRRLGEEFLFYLEDLD